MKKSLRDLSTSDFIHALADRTPAPGGGSVAAYAGAMGAGLCAMVARATAAKPANVETGEMMTAFVSKADELATRFLELMDADTDAYNGVVAAYKLPAKTDDEKACRSQAIQDALLKAADVPLSTLLAVVALTPLVKFVVDHGNPHCITDAGTAVQLMQTAAHSAAYNVRINIDQLKDSAVAAAYTRQVNEGLARVNKVVTALSAAVDAAV